MMNDALALVMNALWQVGAIAVFAVAAAGLLRRGPARHRHLVYLAAIVASLAAPLAAPLAGFLLGLRSATGTVGIPHHALGVAPSVAVSFLARWRAPILILVAAAIAWRLVRLGLAVQRTRAIARRALVPLSGSAQAAAERFARELGVRRFRACSSTEVSSPLTFGALSPTVVVPAALLSPGSEELLSAALGHELAHVRRRDFLAHLIVEILLVPLAFHPAIWLLARGLHRTRELACDELVAGRLVEPRRYARSLIHLAAAAIGAPGHAMGVGAPHLLDERIRRLLAPAPGRSTLRFAVALLAVALATAGAARFRVAFGAIVPWSFETRAAVAAASVGGSRGVDWVTEGIEACRAQDPTDANLAMGQLSDEYSRADMILACRAAGMSYCDEGRVFVIPD
jgi:beta-lactamase regulating signal transducer with metallopeptidase domain